MARNTENVRERIVARVLVEDRGHTTQCWSWQFSVDAYGYAQAWFPERRKIAKVHRVAYEEFVGAIPAGLVIDHLCRNRNCVNPAHLEPVTNAENIRRGRQCQKWTHCTRGHPLSGDNRKGNGNCRACARIWYVENRERLLAKMAAARRSEGGAVATRRAATNAHSNEIAPHVEAL